LSLQPRGRLLAPESSACPRAVSVSVPPSRPVLRRTAPPVQALWTQTIRIPLQIIVLTRLLISGASLEPNRSQANNTRRRPLLAHRAPLPIPHFVRLDQCHALDPQTLSTLLHLSTPTRCLSRAAPGQPLRDQALCSYTALPV
jgi:hypothetical protein